MQVHATGHAEHGPDPRGRPPSSINVAVQNLVAEFSKEHITYGLDFDAHDCLFKSSIKRRSIASACYINI